MKKYTFIISLLFVCNAFAQERDTLKITITKIEKKVKAETVYVFSSRVDTIALQPIITDTSKIVKDINPQDLGKSKYQVRWMGSVRINSYYDYIGMTSTEGFLPYDIPVGVDAIQGLSSVYIGGRQSRIGIEGNANTKVGQIKIYMEVDFASSTSSFWRMRHAYAEWNFFKLGYTWSTFMDNASLPNTVDFEGPNSAVVKRHGIIRFEKKYGEKSIVGLSIEAPQTDYYNPADTFIINKNIQSNFDIAARYKYFNELGHLQIAGLFRRIDYLHIDKMDVMYGWGILVSTVVHLNNKHSLFAQYSVGEGIANYYVGFGGRQLDAVYNPNSMNMTLKNIHGGFINYSYIINEFWRFTFTTGISFLRRKDFEPVDTFWSSKYLAANIFYDPIETIDIGFEVTAGTRTNHDKETGNATRISLRASFDF